MTNIGVKNSNTQKKPMVSQNSWIAMKLCDTLLPNGMPCYHHTKDRVVINRKGQQYL